MLRRLAHFVLFLVASAFTFIALCLMWLMIPLAKDAQGASDAASNGGRNGI